MFYSVRGREVPVNKPPWYIANCNVCSFYVRIFLNLLLFVTCVWWCWVVMLPWKNLLCLKSCIFRNGILPSMIAAFAGPKWARVVFVFIPLLGPICCPNRFSMMSINPQLKNLSVCVSEIIRCFDEMCVIYTAFTQDVKNSFKY